MGFPGSLLPVEPEGFQNRRVINREKNRPLGEGAELKLVIDQSREAMKIDRAVANSEVAEYALLREVQKELGIKGR
jgi:hypothetical protein